jgi:hypothetical protein
MRINTTESGINRVRINTSFGGAARWIHMEPNGMRSSWVFLAMFLVSCGTEQPPGPVVVVDLEHSQVGSDAESPPSYLVPSGPAVVLDATQFDFSKSLYPDVEPTTVQVLLANDRQYHAAWHPSARLALNSRTLQPLNNSPQFGGFKPGDKVMVAIGEQRVDEASKEIILKALWVGLIEFSGGT